MKSILIKLEKWHIGALLIGILILVFIFSYKLDRTFSASGGSPASYPFSNQPTCAPCMYDLFNMCAAVNSTGCASDQVKAFKFTSSDSSFPEIVTYRNSFNDNHAEIAFKTNHPKQSSVKGYVAYNYNGDFPQSNIYWRDRDLYDSVNKLNWDWGYYCFGDSSGMSVVIVGELNDGSYTISKPFDPCVRGVAPVPTPAPYNPPSNPTPVPYNPPSNPTSKPTSTPEPTWSTNFVCALWDKEEEKMSELNHQLVIKCGGQEIYNKSNRIGNMNESILLPEGKSCEATCTPLVSETGMYGYTIGNNLGSPSDKDIKKSSKETIKFTTKKTDNVYRWFFQTSNMIECVKENKLIKSGEVCCNGLQGKNGKCIKKEEKKCIVENKTVKSGQFCCGGLEEKDGKCVTTETASKMKVKILGGAYDANKTTKAISKNIVSMNLECDGNTTELIKTSGSKKIAEYGNFTFNINMPTTAKCTLYNTSENKDYKFKGYTICQNKDIPNCHKEQKINDSNSIDLTEYDLKNNDKLQVRWYYEKGETTSNGVTSDDNNDNFASDNVSTSRINRLIELLEKLLEKLGVK